MKRLVILAAMMGGCAQEPKVVTVVADPPKIHYPSECTQPDPEWRKLPDRDVLQSELARTYDQNRRQYQTVLRRRSVCRAAIKALQN